jgi:polysaccharide biosynthesis transport protein
MSFSQFVAILKARWLVVLSILALALATAIALNMVLPKRYTATTKVMVDVKSPDPVAGIVLPGMLSPTFLATQGDVIKSGRVVEHVIKNLRLDQSQDMQRAWQQATKGAVPFNVWLSDFMLKSLKASPSREANVIEIEYSAETPQGAAVLANAFTDSYLEVTSNLRTEPAKAFGSSFEALAIQLRKRLLDAQAKLTSYQKEAGLMATDERLDVETERLSQISSQVTQLTALVEDARARKNSAQRSGAEVSSEAAGNSVINGIRTDLIAYQAKLGSLQERYGSAHPQVRETTQVIEEFKRRLASEYARTTSTLASTENTLEARLAAAKIEMDSQRDKLIDLREKRSAATLYSRDVDNLQRAYDVVQSRVSQAGMEVQAASTSLAVLEKAQAPSGPSSPKYFLNILMAIFLGSMMAVITALLLELIDRRVRTNQDIPAALHLPVLGVLLKTENASRGVLTRKVPPWVINRGPMFPLPDAKA